LGKYNGTAVDATVVVVVVVVEESVKEIRSLLTTLSVVWNCTAARMTVSLTVNPARALLESDMVIEALG
jgi:hypothetical protein